MSSIECYIIYIQCILSKSVLKNCIPHFFFVLLKIFKISEKAVFMECSRGKP